MNPVVTRIATVGAGLFLCAVPALPAAAGPLHPGPADDRQLPQLTAEATVRTVAAQEEFRMRGTVPTLPAGTEVTLQQRQKKGWVSLPATVRTKNDLSYSMRVKLGMKGPNELRVIACTRPESDAYTMLDTSVCHTSDPVAVTVR
ncbi:hypothetical protein [Streptomyces mesophilus]|uniref:hypothetical protein n=1 Tax=Streptomyces mesophilus TaxID=1775132 RepID=UPI00333032CC